MMRPLIWGDYYFFFTSFTIPRALVIFQPKEIPLCPLQAPWFFFYFFNLTLWLFIFWRSYNFLSVSAETHTKILETCPKISSSLLHSLDIPVSNSRLFFSWALIQEIPVSHLTSLTWISLSWSAMFSMNFCHPNLILRSWGQALCLLFPRTSFCGVTEMAIMGNGDDDDVWSTDL